MSICILKKHIAYFTRSSILKPFDVNFTLHMEKNAMKQYRGQCYPDSKKEFDPCSRQFFLNTILSSILQHLQ